METGGYKRNESPEEFPLKKVSLYKNNVAFYTRKGQVSGNQIVTLSFPEEDADRVVKTLKLSDYDAGFVTQDCSFFFWITQVFVLT